MDESKSNDGPRILPAEPAAPGRREFLGNVAKVAGGLLVGDLAVAATAGAQQPAAPAVATRTFTDWGWPQPYEQISAKSKQWLQGKGWWPLNAAWIVVWSGEEMVGHVLQTQKLLDSVVFARVKGVDRQLTAAELEMMNLTGDGNGFDMVTMPQSLRERVPTANFFQQSGYERNPVARRTATVAGLIADIEGKMRRASQSPGAKDMATAF